MRSDMVTPVAVLIDDSHYETRPGRIVFKSLNATRNINLVLLEIYTAVHLLHAAALVTHGYPALLVAARVLVYLDGRRLHRLHFRENRKIHRCHVPALRRIWSVFLHNN